MMLNECIADIFLFFRSTSGGREIESTKLNQYGMDFCKSHSINWKWNSISFTAKQIRRSWSATGLKMSKRTADDSAAVAGGQPPIKKVQFEPHLIGPVSTLEELDIKVLQFQNKKLAQVMSLIAKTYWNDDWMGWIFFLSFDSELSKESVMKASCVRESSNWRNGKHKTMPFWMWWIGIGTSWTKTFAFCCNVSMPKPLMKPKTRVRFEIDIKPMTEFQRINWCRSFVINFADENEVTTSFLTQLSTWDKEELDDKLANRVQVSKRAVAKVVQVIDRIMQRNEKLALALKGNSEENGGMATPKIEDTLRESQIEIMAANKNLQCLNTSLHEKYHTISLKLKELQDTLTGKETEAAELQNQIDDLQYELGKVRLRNDKLENHLAEAIEKLKTYHQMHGDQTNKNNATSASSGGGSTSGGKSTTSTTSVATQHLEDLQKEVEEYRELANNRLQELDKLHQTHRETLKEVERLKMDVSKSIKWFRFLFLFFFIISNVSICTFAKTQRLTLSVRFQIRQLPESVIVETTEYKCLQSQFSVLYNESMQIKTMLDETRNQLQTSKNQHLRQIEMMESEELIAQKKVRSEMIQMEDVLAQIRKEYEMLRIEFEQNMAANEQTAPINREMRHLITSLQNHNGQLKGEVFRYKRKYKDAAAELLKMKKELDDISAKLNGAELKKPDVKQEGATLSGGGIKEETSSDGSSVKEENSGTIKGEFKADAIASLFSGKSARDKSHYYSRRL